MGEYGSLKNLYKSFKIFLANEKIRKAKELAEKQKTKKENRKSVNTKDKFKLSFFVVLTCFFGFVGTIFTSSKKEEDIIIKDKDDIKKIKHVVKQINKKIIVATDIKEIIVYKEKLKEINNVVVSSKVISKVEKKDVNKSVINITTFADSKLVEINKKEIKIKDKNIKLKDTKKQIEILNEKVDNTNDKSKLIDLKQEIEKLEEKFKKGTLKDEDIKKLDEYLLIYDTAELRKLKEKIDEKITDIETLTKEDIKKIKDEVKKEDIIVIPVINETKENKNDKEKSKITKNELKKKPLDKKQKNDEKIEKLEKTKKELQELKKETKDKIDIELNNDLISCKTIVQKQLLVMEKNVVSIRKIRHNKPTLFNRIKYFVSSSLKLCVSISPLFYFRNKVVGGLTSALLLNNSIRSMRRTLVPIKEEISYNQIYDLEFIIKKQEDVEFKTKEIFDDSLSQITSFKTELTSTFGNMINNEEYKKMLKEVESIETYIVSKQEKYNKQNEQVKILLKSYDK